jgi:hypothetical protein
VKSYAFWNIIPCTVRVNLSLRLVTRALCHDDIWGSGGIAPPFLTSTLDGGEWSASRPEKSPQYSLDRRLGGPHTRSGRSGKSSPLKVNRRFRGTYRLHIQSWSVRKETSMTQAANKVSDLRRRGSKQNITLRIYVYTTDLRRSRRSLWRALTESAGFLLYLLRPWRWRWYVPLKHQRDTA